MKDNELVQVHPRATERNWRNLLSEAIRDPDELCDILDLSPEFRSAAHAAAREFSLVVPRRFVSLIEKGNPNDPLLIQILPLHSEMTNHSGFVEDPTQDATFCSMPGILQKYHGRALLVTTEVCAINCRYCFRRHFNYGELPNGWAQWQESLEEIAQDDSISEVILSGGDPLCLTDSSLQRILDFLDDVAHVRCVRIHTRIPIVLPERITDDFLLLFKSRLFQTIVVIHANHPRELADSCRRSLKKLRESGILMFNQSVLLRGVNDDIEILAELSESLIASGVVPYYLHQLDPVRGAAHFEVPVERGLRLIDLLRARLPGYAVPRYVREEPGHQFKTPLAQ